jgi:hypothetical protein
MERGYRTYFKWLMHVIWSYFTYYFCTNWLITSTPPTPGHYRRGDTHSYCWRIPTGSLCPMRSEFLCQLGRRNVGQMLRAHLFADRLQPFRRLYPQRDNPHDTYQQIDQEYIREVIHRRRRHRVHTSHRRY